MALIYDPTKRDRTLTERGVNFARCREIFDGANLTREDDREDYGETRFITVGWLDDRMMIVVWTPRGTDERIISMRKANDREQKHYGRRLARH